MISIQKKYCSESTRQPQFIAFQKETKQKDEL